MLTSLSSCGKFLERPVKWRKFMKNRKKGSGSIYLVNGIYKLRYMVKGQRKQVSLETRNKKEAQRKAEKILSPAVVDAKTKAEVVLHIAEAKKIISKNRVEISSMWDTYLASSTRPDSGPGTLKNYELQVKRFIKWTESNKHEISNIEDINRDIAIEYATFLSNSKLSPETFNQHIKTLRLVFRILLANHDEPKPSVAFDHVKLKLRDTVNRKAFTEEEVLKLLKSFDDEDFSLPHKDELKILFYIGAWTGLRLSDVISIKWQNFDMCNRLISITPGKTARRARNLQIPIHPMLYDLLNGIEKNDQQLLVPKLSELYFNKGTKKRVLALIKKIFEHIDLKTTEHRTNRKMSAIIYGFHSFRHSFASFAARSGIPIGVLADILGDNITTLQKYYIHIDNAAKFKAISSMPVLQISNERPINILKYDIIKRIESISDQTTLEAILSILQTKG